MKKNIIQIVLLSLSVSGLVCSCGEKKPLTIKKGVYWLADTDTSITIGDNNTLTVHGYDFKKLEEEAYENFMIRMEQANMPEGEKISDERIEQIRDGVDLTKQFLDKTVDYETQDEDGVIGIYVPVNNSELFFYVQYFPNNESLVFDEHIFKRKDK